MVFMLMFACGLGALVVAYDWARSWRLGTVHYAVAGVTSGIAASAYYHPHALNSAVLAVSAGALFALFLWTEHMFRLADVVHWAVETAVATERRRVSSYLRRQSKIAEVVSTCGYLGHRGRDQEAYASAVLEETAWEIDSLQHHAQVEP